MAVVMTFRWDDAGTLIPVGQAKYAVNEQPVAEYDNWAMYTLAADMQDVIDDVINKFNANTILKADTDNTPAALAIAEQTIVGRKTGSSIAALTATEVRTILNVESGADVTDSTNVNAAGAVMESDFNANTILRANIDNLPGPLSVGTNTFVGRTTGNIAALSDAAARSVLNVEDGATADQTGAEIKSAYEAEANAYTDTKNTKLAGIDTGADVTADNPPQAHNQSAATITSGILAVARGGTGVNDDSYDADKVDGCDAGLLTNDVLKIPNSAEYSILYYNGNLGPIAPLGYSTDGYQLTTHSSASAPTWSASSDLIFSDTHCPKCGEKFQDGDDLILHVIEHNEMGDILTLPMHLSCANEPKKRVSIKRKTMEEVYILDECTGDVTTCRVQKMQEKTLSKHVLKSGYVIDKKNGKVYAQGDDGNPRGKECNISDIIDVVEEVVVEGMYEDVGFEL